MISNGYKVIGIEESGNVEYDVMSSCPVSPSKPKFDGSIQKSISKEIQDAIKRYLSSNRPSLAVMQDTPTHALDADFMEILVNKRNEQLKAVTEKSLNSESTNREIMFDATANKSKLECDDMFRCEDGITDDLENCSVNDKDDKSNESTFYENEFSS